MLPKDKRGISFEREKGGSPMGQKERLINEALAEVMELRLDRYHTIFLANMVVRRINKPTAKMDVLAEEVMADMPLLYEKKNLIVVSARRSLENLEEALDGSKTIPESWLTGQVVSHTVKALAERISAKVFVPNNTSED